VSADLADLSPIEHLRRIHKAIATIDMPSYLKPVRDLLLRINLEIEKVIAKLEDDQ
jgi:hypothetical protein